MTLLPGDYACRNMGGTPGKLISVGEWLNGNGFSIYDHAEVYVGLADKAGPYGYTMGAYPGGAHLVALQECQVAEPGKYGFLWSSGKILLTDAERTAIVSCAMACKGIPYSALDYFALAAHRLHIPVPGLRDYIKDTRHLICSELVDFCYMTAGVHLFHNVWQGYVTPAMLANLILE